MNTKNSLMACIAIVISGYAVQVQAQPDLKIDLSYLSSTMDISIENFSSNDCDVTENCTQAGQRKLLRFGQRIQNVGDDDFDLGKPKNKNYFDEDPCHEHFHFQGFAKYEIYDFNCSLVLPGGKLGGCMINFDPVGHPGNEDCGESRFNRCKKDKHRQGISAGCADVYVPTLECQYVDITTLSNGRYFLKATINFDQTLIANNSNLQESDYVNNTAYILFDLQGNIVTVKYAAHIIPSNLVLQNIDNLPPPFPAFFKSQLMFIARNTIEIKGETTFDNNIDREIVAGTSITISADDGPVTISASQGGSTHLYIDPCLATASFKMANDEGLFAGIDAPIATTDSITDTEEDGFEIELNSNSQSFTIYPNPSANGQFNLNLTNPNEERVRIHVHDVHGKLILKKTTTTDKAIIDLSKEAKGLYSVNIIKGNKVITDLILNQ